MYIVCAVYNVLSDLILMNAYNIVIKKIVIWLPILCMAME